MLISILDYTPAGGGYPDVQAALDAAADGDRIYLPAGVYGAPVAGPWKITKSVEIFGDGPGRSGDTSGTVLQRTVGNVPIFELVPPTGSLVLGQVLIRDLKFVGPTPGIAPGSSVGPSGIKCTVPSGGKIQSLRFDRVLVESLSGPGFGLDASPGAVESLSMDSCFVVNVTGIGVVMNNVGIGRMSRGGGGRCSEGWLRAESSGVAMYVIECEADGLGAAAQQGPMLLTGCSIAHVEACRYEGYYAATVPTGLEFKDCGGAAQAACNSFVKNDNTVKATTGIKVSASSINNNCPATVFTNNFIRIYGLVDAPGAMVDATNSHQGCVVYPQFQNGDSGGTVHPGAIALPAFPNSGLFASPSIVSSAPGVSVATMAGLVIPSGSSPPTASLQNGMLFFAVESPDPGDNHLYVRISGAWRKVVTT